MNYTENIHLQESRQKFRIFRFLATTYFGLMQERDGDTLTVVLVGYERIIAGENVKRAILFVSMTLFLYIILFYDFRILFNPTRNSIIFNNRNDCISDVWILHEFLLDPELDIISIRKRQSFMKFN